MFANDPPEPALARVSVFSSTRARVSARARTRRGDARGARRPQTPEPNETRDETAGDATWPQPLVVVAPTRVAPARRAREDAGARGAAAAGPSAEVADIVASGVNLQPGTLDWSSAEDYAEWQRSNPDWQKTIVAMSKVQVMPDGEIIARKLNTPINDYPHEPFRRIALDPRMTALASEFLGGRQALVYSDQVFIKPPVRPSLGPLGRNRLTRSSINGLLAQDVGGPKPYHLSLIHI